MVDEAFVREVIGFPVLIVAFVVLGVLLLPCAVYDWVASKIGEGEKNGVVVGVKEAKTKNE